MIKPLEKHFTAGVYIFRKTDQLELLLIHHKKHDKWLIPGGHIDPWENPAEAAVREAKEETGIDVVLKELSEPYRQVVYEDATSIQVPQYMFEELIPEYNGEPEHIHIDCLYFGIPKNNLPPEQNIRETHGIRWFRESDLEAYDIFDMTKNTARRYFDQLKQVDESWWGK